MDIQKIIEKYNQGEYKHDYSYKSKVKLDHVFDENLSVKQNREMAIKHNADIDIERANHRSAQIILEEKLDHDIICYITESYDLDYNTAKKVQQFCYKEKHHCMHDYFYYIDTIASFVEGLFDSLGEGAN